MNEMKRALVLLWALIKPIVEQDQSNGNKALLLEVRALVMTLTESSRSAEQYHMSRRGRHALMRAGLNPETGAQLKPSDLDELPVEDVLFIEAAKVPVLELEPAAAAPVPPPGV